MNAQLQNHKTRGGQVASSHQALRGWLLQALVFSALFLLTIPTMPKPVFAGNEIKFSDVIPGGISRRLSALGDISLWKSNMQKAKKAYRKGKFAKARKYFRKALKDGNFIAAWYLGHIHRLGLGVPADNGKAFKYYRTVALEYDAQNADRRVTQITVDALTRVADGYRTGIKSIKLARDYRRAMRLYRTASNRGHPGAQYGLGLMYLTGKGVRKNPAKGIRWINFAARKNYPPALGLLGEYFWKGKYLKKSRSRALMMYMVATQNTVEELHPKLFDRYYAMSNKSSQDDILLAERLTQIWYERHPSRHPRFRQAKRRLPPPPPGPRPAFGAPPPGPRDITGNRKAFAPN